MFQIGEWCRQLFLLTPVLKPFIVEVEDLLIYGVGGEYPDGLRAVGSSIAPYTTIQHYTSSKVGFDPPVCKISSRIK